MNQIKKARKLKGMSQKDLADKLALTQQAISYYEKGSRIPDEHMWVDLSKNLGVPIEYLKGEISDPVGWELWEKATGHSVEQIKKEIIRMKEADHIIGDIDDTQNVIGQAVMNLEGYGNTDRGIIEKLARSVSMLQNELQEKYQDPKKIENFIVKGNTSLTIIPADVKYSELIFDDLNPEAYELVEKILHKASTDLRNIPFDLDLY